MTQDTDMTANDTDRRIARAAAMDTDRLLESLAYWTQPRHTRLDSAALRWVEVLEAEVIARKAAAR